MFSLIHSLIQKRIRDAEESKSAHMASRDPFKESILQKHNALAGYAIKNNPWEFRLLSYAADYYYVTPYQDFRIN